MIVFTRLKKVSKKRRKEKKKAWWFWICVSVLTLSTYWALFISYVQQTENLSETVLVSPSNTPSVSLTSTSPSVTPFPTDSSQLLSVSSSQSTSSSRTFSPSPSLTVSPTVSVTPSSFESLTQSTSYSGSVSSSSSFSSSQSRSPSATLSSSVSVSSSPCQNVPDLVKQENNFCECEDDTCFSNESWVILDANKTALSPLHDHYEVYFSTSNFARNLYANETRSCGVSKRLITATNVEGATTCGKNLYRFDVPLECWKDTGKLNISGHTLFLEALLLSQNICQFYSVATSIYVPASSLLPAANTHQIMVDSFLTWRTAVAYRSQLNLVVFNPCPQYVLLSNASQNSLQEGLEENTVSVVGNTSLSLMNYFIPTYYLDSCWTIQFIEIHFESLNCSLDPFELGVEVRLMWGVHDLSKEEHLGLVTEIPGVDGCSREIAVDMDVEFVLTNLSGTILANKTDSPIPLQTFRTDSFFSLCILIVSLPSLYGEMQWVDVQISTESGELVPYDRIPSLNDEDVVQIFTEDPLLLEDQSSTNRSYCLEFNYTGQNVLVLHFNVYSELTNSLITPYSNLTLQPSPDSLAMRVLKEDHSLDTKTTRPLEIPVVFFFFTVAAILIIMKNRGGEVRKTKENVPAAYYFVE